MFSIYTIGVIIITAVSSNAIISRTLYKTEIQGFKDSRGREQYEELERVEIERREELTYHYKNGNQETEIRTNSEIIHTRN